MEKEQIVILSLGGSLIVPEIGIDTEFLRKFRDFILKEVKKGRKFLIIAGGGKTARMYRDAGKKVVGKLTTDDLDWIGVHATRMNAHLLRTIFRKYAHPKLITNPTKGIETKEPIIIAAGWKPGWSTDYCAVMAAKNYGAKTIINLSNIDKVFNKDPQKFSDAKPINRISWDNFQELVGDKWIPGMNMPFDPIASKLAKDLDLTVMILNGRNMTNLTAAIDGKKFIGTVVKSG